MAETGSEIRAIPKPDDLLDDGLVRIADWMGKVKTLSVNDLHRLMQAIKENALARSAVADVPDRDAIAEARRKIDALFGVLEGGGS